MAKKNKTPLPLRMIAWLFPKVEIIAPWLAKRWFIRIFFSTARYPYPPAEKEIMAKAKKSTLILEGKRVQIYQWGSGVPVLFVHGWMGRATQFRKFIPILVERGYEVLAFDATGHGLSEGKNSHLLEFAQIMLSMQERHGRFELVVGHSLGGVAALHAVKRGLKIGRLVMISSPTIADEILLEFRKKIGASEKCLTYFEKRFQAKFNMPFRDFEGKEVAKELSGFDLLLIYDHNDKEVSMDNPRAILQSFPRAQLITTRGLGHTRILKDDKVVNFVVDFVEGATLPA